MVNSKDRKTAINLIKKETRNHFQYKNRYCDQANITNQSYIQGLCDMAEALGINTSSAGMNPFPVIHLVGE